MKHGVDDYSEPLCSKSCSCAGQPEVRSTNGNAWYITSLLLTTEGCVRAEMGMAPWLTQFQHLSQIHLQKMIPNYALKSTSQAPCFLSTWTGPFPPTLFHH